MLRALLVFIALPVAVEAGPWPRGTGQSFVAFSSEQALGAHDPDPYLNLYIEHGLTEKLTANLSFGLKNFNLKDAALGKAILGLSWSFHQPSRQNRYSLEIAAGYEQAVLLQAGFSAGRSFEILGNDAWGVFRTSWTHYDDDDFLFDADITIGVRSSPETSLIFKALTSTPNASRFMAKLGASAFYHVNARTRIELGYISGITKTENIGKANLWLDF